MSRVRVMKDGKQVASAQNLEVIYRYQRQVSSVKSVSQRGHYHHVSYDDGAKVKTRFASKSVLKDWIEGRRKRGVFPPARRRRRRR